VYAGNREPLWVRHRTSEQNGRQICSVVPGSRDAAAVTVSHALVKCCCCPASAKRSALARRQLLLHSHWGGSAACSRAACGRLSSCACAAAATTVAVGCSPKLQGGIGLCDGLMDCIRLFQSQSQPSTAHCSRYDQLLTSLYRMLEGRALSWGEQRTHPWDCERENRQSRMHAVRRTPVVHAWRKTCRL
jgi:hypothetical protein